MSDAPLTGRLEDRPFAALVGRLFRDAAGGELRLDGAERARRVWFVGGNPVAVLSDDPRDHVAQVLLEHGKISPADAGRLAALPETREGVGAADFLPKDTLSWGIKYRFVNLCYDLFRWEEGDFAFTPGTPPRELLLLKIPAPTLVLKGVGYMARHAVADALPDEAILAPGEVSAASASWLGADERALLAECRPGRTVGDVLGRGWNDADQARQGLLALLSLGLLSVSQASPLPAAGAGHEEEAVPPEFEIPEPAPLPAAQSAAAASPGFTFDGDSGGEEPGLHLPATDLGGVSGATDSFLLSTPGGYPGGSLSDEIGGGATGFGFADPDEEQDRGGAPRAEPQGKAGRAAARRFSFAALPRSVSLAAAGAVVLLLGAGAWFWFSGREQPPVAPPRVAPPPPPSAPTAQAPASAPLTTTVAPAPPAAAPTTPSPAAPAAGPAPAAPALPAAGPAPAAPALPAAGPAPATPTPAATVVAPAATGLPAQPLSARYRSGLEVLNAGDVDAAAAVWESLLAEEHTRDYTVLAATLCEVDSVRALVRSFGGRAPVFLVTRQVKGRGCFRVCYGTFRSREAARPALEAMPAELRSSGAAVWSVADALTTGR